MTLANGVITTYTYDANHNTKSIVTKKGTAVLQNLVYTRNDDGYITSFTSPFAGEAWSYTYGNVVGYQPSDDHVLTKATNTSNAADNQSFTYSASGNILTNSHLGTYTYPASGATSVRPHAVISAGGVSYSYDENGNMTFKGSTQFIWDANNRLVNVGGVTYAYDANDERVKKVSGSIVTHYPQADYRVQAGVVTKSIGFGGSLVATRKGNVTHWLHKDHLGSTQVLTDLNGAVVQRMSHRAFGERFGTTSSVEQELDFLGERRDQETGLVFQRSRYYDPALARYTSADTSDPNSNGVGVNRYAFALNNPVTFTDNGNEAIHPVINTVGFFGLHILNSLDNSTILEPLFPQGMNIEIGISGNPGLLFSGISLLMGADVTPSGFNFAMNTQFVDQYGRGGLAGMDLGISGGLTMGVSSPIPFVPGADPLFSANSMIATVAGTLNANIGIHANAISDENRDINHGAEDPGGALNFSLLGRGISVGFHDSPDVGSYNPFSYIQSLDLFFGIGNRASFGSFDQDFGFNYSLRDSLGFSSQAPSYVSNYDYGIFDQSYYLDQSFTDFYSYSFGYDSFSLW